VAAQWAASQEGLSSMSVAFNTIYQRYFLTVSNKLQSNNINNSNSSKRLKLYERDKWVLWLSLQLTFYLT
jgi:hypothetical protein